MPEAKKRYTTKGKMNNIPSTMYFFTSARIVKKLGLEVPADEAGVHYFKNIICFYQKDKSQIGNQND